MDNVDLGGAGTLDEVQQRIRTFAAAHADRSLDSRTRLGLRAVSRQPADARSSSTPRLPDRPAVMRCYDGHSIWVNSKALALAGITKDTPDPPNGTIVRDPETGEPTGLLKESPASVAGQRSVVPKPTRAEERRGAEGGDRRGAEVRRHQRYRRRRQPGGLRGLRRAAARRRAGRARLLLAARHARTSARRTPTASTRSGRRIPTRRC